VQGRSTLEPERAPLSPASIAFVIGRLVPKAIQSGGLAWPGPFTILYHVNTFPGAVEPFAKCMKYPPSLRYLSFISPLHFHLPQFLRRRSSSATDPAKESPTAIAILCTEFTLHSSFSEHAGAPSRSTLPLLTLLPLPSFAGHRFTTAQLI